MPSDFARHLEQMSFMERVEWEDGVRRACAKRKQRAALNLVAERKQELVAQLATMFPEDPHLQALVPAHTQHNVVPNPYFSNRRFKH